MYIYGCIISPGLGHHSACSLIYIFFYAVKSALLKVAHLMDLVLLDLVSVAYVITTLSVLIFRSSNFAVSNLVSLGCGSTSSENNTYWVKSGFTSLTEPCVYTICKCSSNICRIRLDFDVIFVIVLSSAMLCML